MVPEERRTEMSDTFDRMPEGRISRLLPWCDPLSDSTAVTYGGVRYSCMEAAYQAQKTADLDGRRLFAALDGQDALRIGAMLFPVRHGWAAQRHGIMEGIAAAFIQGLGERQKEELRETVAKSSDSDELASLWRRTLDGAGKEEPHPCGNDGGYVAEQKPSQPRAEDASGPDGTVVGTCPWCGSPVVKNGKCFACTNDSCGGRLSIDNKYLKRIITDDAARILFSGGKIENHAVSARNGKPYTSLISLKRYREKDGDVWYSFETDFPKNKDGWKK